ncbi:MAG: chorismate mutase [Erysipelotrichaceae bacterium]|nr:chorismate mutase [Erysipelotrichaceae bacterium]
MKTLEEARQIIDEVDEQIAKLFEKRMQAVESIVAYKLQHDLPIFDPSREQQVIAKNIERIENEVYRPYFAEFLQHTMEVSKKYQRAFIENKED